jgi:hypothetical protein
MISPRFRTRRLKCMHEALNVQPGESLLDVGGYPWCWPAGATPARVTLLNKSFPSEACCSNFDRVTADACALPFAKEQFAIAFSNSVIEHVGTWERQQAFAREVRRVAQRLWVQTPAREFFVEPHLIAPFVHWLPSSYQKRLIRWFTGWGWLARPNGAEINQFLSEVRLLNRAEMKVLFPDCEILTERFLGLPKSYIAVRRR